jgi:spermidine/putrescine transport system permease protein
MRRLRGTSWGGLVLGAVVVAYIAWSLLPVGVAFLFSFNRGYSRSVWQGFSTQWWIGSKSVFKNPTYADAITHSLLLAGLAVAITVPLGVSLAVLLSRWHGPGRRGLSLLATVPLVVPELVLSLAMFFLVTKLLKFILLGTPAQVVGQVTFILPLVIVITRGRLASIAIGFEEAATDLGATSLGSIRLVLLPLLQPAILASTMVTFAVSIDDFVITQYMSSTSATESVPMVIYNATRGAATPVLNAMAVVMAVTTILIAGLGFLGYRLLVKREQFGALEDEPELAVPGLATVPATNEGVWW